MSFRWREDFFFSLLTCGPLRPGNILADGFSCPPEFKLPVWLEPEPVPLWLFFFFLLLWRWAKFSSCNLDKWFVDCCKLLLPSLRFVWEWILPALTLEMRTMAMLNYEQEKWKTTEAKNDNVNMHEQQIFLFNRRNEIREQEVSDSRE